MAGRNCGTCGASVPVLADFCPRCGADPDLQLVEVGALELGRRRRGRPPDSDTDADTDGDHPGARRRWWPVLAGAVVVVVLVGVLATAPEEDAEREEATPSTPATRAFERDEPEHPRRSTTTSTSRPPGPVLGGPTGLLLTAGGTRTIFDLDTGERTDLRATVLGSHEGRLLVDTGADLAWWPAPFDGSGAELVAQGVRADQAWVDPRDGTVWVVRWESAPTTVVTGIGAAGERAAVDLPVSFYPVGTVGGSLVVGLPGGTFAIDLDGRARLLSAGQPVAATGDRVFVSTCDETLSCVVRVLTADGAETEVLPFTDAGMYGYGQGLASSDGRLALVEGDDTGAIVRVGDRVLDDLPTPYVNAICWSPDGRWLFVSGERVVRAWEVDTGRTVDVDVDGELQAWPLLVVGR